MEIDIINYTEEQMATLSNEQLLEVRQAQEKKNKLTAKLAEELTKVDTDMAQNGFYQSTLRQDLRNKIQADYDAEIELLREGLLFYLRYSYRPGSGQAPYTVDYSLSDEERLEIVKTYYMTTYTDGNERLEAFKSDTVARQYLGELYAPLYHYLVDAATLL